jgi:3-deoxy-manno-octulosonate cytidylyltransferase (CMP-KDO synthetase)
MVTHLLSRKKKMKYIGIIPARYASTRFPGKPLADINGKPMIRHTYERAKEVLDTVYVATDDERIEKAVLNFNGNVVMTSPDHKSGSDRCAEAINQIEKITGKNFDVVINIQGDEPLLEISHLRQLMDCFNEPETQIATLVKKIEKKETIFDPNIVKVIFDKDHNAIYFSRTPVPHLRDIDKEKWQASHTYFKHIGIYAFKKNYLTAVTNLQPSSLELSESLEQLRWLENGFRIRVSETEIESISIDTPDDLEKI